MQIIYIKKSDSGADQNKLIDLTVRNESLILCDPETQRELHQLSLSAVHFSRGGNNNRLIFFHSAKMGADKAYFELNSESRKFIHSHKQLNDKLLPYIGATTRFSAVTVVSILVLGLIFYSLFHYRSAIFGSLSFMIPFKVEQKIGDQVFNPRLNDAQKKTLASFQPLVDTLKFEKSDWNYPFHFHISSDTVPNAYASLGGHVFINKGLIKLLDEPEDLLGVVAHEMIHVQRRHVVKSAIQVMGTYTVMSLFLGDITGIVAVLVDQGAPLLSLSYSRDLEEEADKDAVDLLVRNNIDPGGLARSLKKINEESQKLIKQSPASDILEKLSKIEVLSSHPEIDQRIAKLENMAKEKVGTKIFSKIKYDYKKLQTDVQNTF